MKGNNAQHRCNIMRAYTEVASQKEQDVLFSQTLFNECIVYASETGHKHDAGLAAQMAAEYFFSLAQSDKKTGDISVASLMLSRQYFARARNFYKSWGAVTLETYIAGRIQNLPLKT